jgi:hypothetical protein
MALNGYKEVAPKQYRNHDEWQTAVNTYNSRYSIPGVPLEDLQLGVMIDVVGVQDSQAHISIPKLGTRSIESDIFGLRPIYEIVDQSKVLITDLTPLVQYATENHMAMAFGAYNYEGPNKNPRYADREAYFEEIELIRKVGEDPIGYLKRAYIIERAINKNKVKLSNAKEVGYSAENPKKYQDMVDWDEHVLNQAESDYLVIANPQLGVPAAHDFMLFKLENTTVTILDDYGEKEIVFPEGTTADEIMEIFAKLNPKQIKTDTMAIEEGTEDARMINGIEVIVKQVKKVGL